MNVKLQLDKSESNYYNIWNRDFKTRTWKELECAIEVVHTGNLKISSDTFTFERIESG